MLYVHLKLDFVSKCIDAFLFISDLFIICSFCMRRYIIHCIWVFYVYFRDGKESDTVIEMNSQGNIPEHVEKHHATEPQAFARAR
jgi:hypothetical protein